MFKNSMIISSNGRKKFYVCSISGCKNGSGNEIIPTYYSYEHAWTAGWTFANHIKYCPPDKKYAWICPFCQRDDHDKYKK
jgi:hypothetical protein